jgi:hypothetical protein
LRAGHRIEQNIIFNTCRESGDHGPLNSWDRQPFSMSAGAEPVPAVTVTRNNLIFADYQGVKGLDHGAIILRLSFLRARVLLGFVASR